MALKNIFPICCDSLPETSQSICIGPSQSFKSSLLFQFCYTCLQQQPDSVVLVICPQQVQQLPLLVQRMSSPTADQANRLQIIYLTTLEDLLDYLARMNTLDMRLSAIAVDDLNLFMMRRREVRRTRDQLGYEQLLGRIFALLQDTIGHLENKSSPHSPSIQLLIMSSFDQHFTHNLAAGDGLCRQFFDQVFLVRFIKSEEQQTKDHPRMVELQEPLLGLVIHFIRNNQFIVLKSVLKRKTATGQELPPSPKA